MANRPRCSEAPKKLPRIDSGGVLEGAKSKSSVTIVTILAPTVLSKGRVVAAAQPLRVNGMHVVASAGQRGGHVVVQVLVDLEPHQAAPGVKGITVSRASSAAYWTAAYTSSRSRW